MCTIIPKLVTRQRASCVWSLWLAALFFVFPSPTVNGEDSFDTLRESVRTPSPPSTSNDSPPAVTRLPKTNSANSTGQSSYFGDNTQANDAWGGLFLLAFAAPFTIPQALAGDRLNAGGNFPRFPYDANLEGSMVIDQDDFHPQRWQSFRARAEYAANFGGGEREGIQFLYENATRVGIDTDNNYRSHVRLNGQRDSVWTGDTNLVLRFAQTETWQLRTGVGVNWLTDNVGSNAGFNFTYGGDWFPVKPWVLSTEIDAGFLGNAGLFHFRTSVGVLLKRYEIYTGYDYYDVGKFQSQGMMSGLRFWF